MSAATTLTELLERSGARVHAYDLGRRVGRLPREDLLAFEQAHRAYPFPMQRKAWIGWIQQPLDATASEPVVWFLCLDLDEQGLLVQAERDYLLSRLFESAQASRSGADPQVFLRDNPYAFTPSETRMALFHAQLGVDLGLPPSRFYAHALDYFRGEPGWSQWEFVGYQGIADVACRHPGEPLDGALPHLPTAPLQALCHCLENQVLSDSLVTALLRRLEHEREQSQGAETDTVAALLRALARRTSERRVRQAIVDLLGDAAGVGIEVLAALSGRAWEALRDHRILARYLSRLADDRHGQEAFNACLGDLLSLPEMTQTVRDAMRDPAQPARVRAAFGRMLGSARRDN